MYGKIKKYLEEKGYGENESSSLATKAASQIVGMSSPLCADGKSRRNSCEPRQQPAFCQDCGDKLVERSDLPRDIWKDPYVKERLKDGVPAWDIAVCRCPECNQLGYYNEGSTFSCRFCDLTFYVVGEEHDHCEGVRTVSAEEVIHLDDTVTETTDGYHNATQ